MMLQFSLQKYDLVSGIQNKTLFIFIPEREYFRDASLKGTI